MVDYFTQNCDNAADWAVQYNSRPTQAFWEITTGESISGGSLRTYMTSSTSYTAKLILSNNISSYIPPVNGLYQYYLSFWFKYKTKGVHPYASYSSSTSNYFPAVFVETDTNRLIGGIGFGAYSQTYTPDRVNVFALYANVGDTQGGMLHNVDNYAGIDSITVDTWHHFEALITPVSEKIFLDGTFILEDIMSRPNLPPSKLCVQASQYTNGGIEDILIDEITLFSIPSFTLDVTATANGTVNPVPGQYVYSEGAEVTVTAEPNLGYRLGAFQLNGEIFTSNPFTFVITQNSTLHVVFELDIPPENTPPIANFSWSASDLTASFDGSASIPTMTGATIVGYTWDYGDGQFGSGQTSNHTFAAAGTYNVTLTVTDSNNMNGSIIKSVTVTTGEVPTNPVADYVTNMTGFSVIFNGNTSYPTTPDAILTDYSWNFGDGQLGTGVTVTHVYAVPDTYMVTLTVTDSNGLTGTMTRSVTVTGTVADAGFPWWMLVAGAVGVGTVGYAATRGGKKNKKRRK